MRQIVLISLLIAVALTGVSLSHAIKAKPELYLPASRPESTQEQALGGITCRVVNAQSQPVPGVTVHAYLVPLIKQRPVSGRSDRNGMFTIRGLAVGRYELSVSRKEAGYDDTFDPFYAAGFVRMPEVIVYAGQTVSCGDIHLGPKAGKLVGTLRDAKTKKGVISNTSSMQTRHVILCRLDDPKNCSDASPNRNGDFEILVPPVPFTVKATAPGYEKKDLGPLRLKRGEIRRFDILLTPTN
jgi:carboxypeptidase family protein